MDKYGVMNKVTSLTEYTYWYDRQKNLGPPYDTQYYVQYIVAEGEDPRAYYWDGQQVLLNDSWEDPNALSQLEADRVKYSNRYDAKREIFATMAANNMARVRSGTWTVSELISLTQDAELKQVQDDVNSLSFELALAKLAAVTNPLFTQAVKDEYSALLAEHLYNA